MFFFNFFDFVSTQSGVASECLKNIEKINDYQWPKVDAKYLILDSVKIVVQINGKKKDIIEAKSNLSEDELLNKVKDTSKIAKNLEGKEIIAISFLLMRL